MTTLAVLCKWCPDPADVRVGADGRLSTDGARSTVSEYDRVALEVAVTLATGSDRVLAITAGDTAIDTSLARKSILSRGVDELHLVADDRLARADARQTGAVLAAMVGRVGEIDVLLCGAGSANRYAQQVGVHVAEQLGWPVVSEVAAVTSLRAGSARVERRDGDGLDVLDVDLPAVLATTADAAVPRVPGMRDVLSASKKPVVTWTLDELGPRAAVASSATVRAVRAPRGPVRRRLLFDGDAEEAARQLVSALRSEGVLS